MSIRYWWRLIYLLRENKIALHAETFFRTHFTIYCINGEKISIFKYFLPTTVDTLHKVFKVIHDRNLHLHYHDWYTIYSCMKRKLKYIFIYISLYTFQKTQYVKKYILSTCHNIVRKSCYWRLETQTDCRRDMWHSKSRYM